jgi:hypothetical protein
VPYIKPEHRYHVDEHIDFLVRALKHDIDDEDVDGIANYIITSILCEIFLSKLRYRNIARLLGCLEACKMEFYRRIAEPYEDEAVCKHGDIDVFGVISNRECVPISASATNEA